ncbi:complex I NDUFA9 subunit family protein [Geoalkalibacter halelectricus]|uniref:complex I NDUFA9 subunit family protein n=1 Tax=Geoalkalibacter halelectricus TaxID=2847045 RepID=UPI003D19033F
MKVFVTGGTGFVGHEVVRQLIAQGHEVVALVRSGSEDKVAQSEQVKIHTGDVTEPDSLPQGMQGCDAVIHLVGIIRQFPDKGVTFERLHVEGSRNVREAAAAQGVKRLLHMSANGTRQDAETGYHKTKWQAEQELRDSELDWTIFRPSLIFGPGGEFVEMLAELIRKLPVVPVIGDGQYRIQPVSVVQVAETFVKALTLPETSGQIYHLGGAESYTYDEVLDLTGKALGKDKVHKLHQPVPMVKPIVKLLEDFEKFPLTQDQLTMLLEGNECNIQNWTETFSIQPISYAEGIGECFRG